MSYSFGDSVDCSSPGFSVRGISQVQILECIAISSSRVSLYFLILCASKLSYLSCAQLFAALWTVARQAPLSMWFSRHEYWSGLPGFPQGIFTQGWDPCLLPLLQGSLPLEPPGEAQFLNTKEHAYYTWKYVGYFQISLDIDFLRNFKMIRKQTVYEYLYGMQLLYLVLCPWICSKVF